MFLKQEIEFDKVVAALIVRTEGVNDETAIIGCYNFFMYISNHICTSTGTEKHDAEQLAKINTIECAGRKIVF